MAQSTYITKNMTGQQVSFLLDLNDRELDIFSLQDLKAFFSSKYANLSELVENLVQKKVLSRIERGKYCRANFRDELVIGSALVPDGVIAYWSAMNIHGLTEQFPNKFFVQTSHRKKSKRVFGVEYMFVQTEKSHIAGVVTEGFGNHQYRITDKEKTIIDCFNRVDYSGGYAELIRAFYQTELDVKKMVAYARAVNNIAATKRMGFIAELSAKRGMMPFVEFAKKQVNDTYSLIDPTGIQEGEFTSEWKLRLNITRDEILDIVKVKV